tara:strand:- start:228 stop:701 length:474 start_codon:yes stop_codon:yes gene_type:complete
MGKFNSKGFFKDSNKIILVMFQFLIISLHFIKLEFLNKKEIIPSNSIFHFLGFIIIIIASIIMLFAIKDLGRNLSPFPRPIADGKLVTSGIYRFCRHPMYYSLILISLGFFIINLSLYNLFLLISLTLVIKLKIIFEEQYLKIKFKNYLLYKDKVKY